MNHPGRYLIAILLSVVFAVSGVSLDFNANRVVVLEYPGADEADRAFLLGLVSYLESAAETGEERFEIEITGLLPSTGHEGKIDFHLTTVENGRRGVLYRHEALASYKRAAVSVRQLESKDETSAGLESGSRAIFSSDYRVRKGQMIKVTLVSGLVRLEVNGEAMQSGGGSDRIRVKVRETGKEFVGTIVGPLEVNVVL